MLLGAALGDTILPAGPRASERASRALLGAGVGALGLAAALRHALPRLSVGLHAGSDPAFFFERLGVLLVPTAALAWLTRSLGPLPRPIRTVAGESLVVYVTHLLLIFDPRLGPGRRFARALPLGPALALSALMIALSFAAGLAAPRARAALRAHLDALRERARPRSREREAEVREEVPQLPEVLAAVEVHEVAAGEPVQARAAPMVPEQARVRGRREPVPDAADHVEPLA